jgi:hypothetical protein
MKSSCFKIEAGYHLSVLDRFFSLLDRYYFLNHHSLMETL